MTYDPSLKYALQVAIEESDIAADPALLLYTRRELRADMAPYPGVLLWLEEIHGGTRVITVAKYPPIDAERVMRHRSGSMSAPADRPAPRLTQAEEIARLRALLAPLVASTPIQYRDGDNPYCAYCGAFLSWPDRPGYGIHALDCPWLAARDALRSCGNKR